MAELGVRRGIIKSASELHSLSVAQRAVLQDAAAERIRSSSENVSLVVAHVLVRSSSGFIAGFSQEAIVKLSVTGIVLLSAYSGEVYGRQVMKVGGKRAVASSPTEIELFQRLVESSVVQQAMLLGVPFEVVENSQERIGHTASSILRFLAEQDPRDSLHY